MRHLLFLGAIAGLVGLAAGSNFAAAAGSGGKGDQGAVVQTTPPPVSQNPSLPPLHLTDAQRAKIRQALSSENTEVGFALKTTQAAKNFQPSVGAQVPKGLRPVAFPRSVTSEMPLLKRYTYLKFKQQVLIVNPMTSKIVDIFPEKPGDKVGS
jgi:hypothetical protein